MDGFLGVLATMAEIIGILCIIIIQLLGRRERREEAPSGDTFTPTDRARCRGNAVNISAICRKHNIQPAEDLK